MNPFKKVAKWASKQYGRGPSMSGLKSSIKGAAQNPLTYAAIAAPFLTPTLVAGGAKLGGLFKSAPSGVGDALGLGDMGTQGGRFRSIGKFLGGKDGFGMDDLLDIGSAAGSAYGAYRSGQAQDKRLQMAEDEWRRRAPLRDAGMKMLMDNSTPDTSAIFNAPEPRYRRVRVGSMG